VGAGHVSIRITDTWRAGRVVELRQVLKSCFASPATSLGRIERNCEVKILFLAMWEIGWDPVHQLLLDFQIDKEAVGEGTYMRVAPDIIVRNQSGIVLAGDAKHWEENLNKYFNQIRKYQTALGVKRAFLTNGHRWVVFDINSDSPAFDEDFHDPERMISTLRIWIGPSSVTWNGVFKYDKIVEKGLSLHKENGSVDIGSKWDPNNYENPTARKVLTLLNKLVDDYPEFLTRDARKNIFIKCRGGKLIEYSPETNTIAATKSDHANKLRVPQNLSDDYHRFIRNNRRIASDPEGLLKKLRPIAKSLEEQAVFFETSAPSDTR
jgi:hypothetical protein